MKWHIGVLRRNLGENAHKSHGNPQSTVYSFLDPQRSLRGRKIGLRPKSAVGTSRMLGDEKLLFLLLEKKMLRIDEENHLVWGQKTGYEKLTTGGRKNLFHNEWF